MNLHFVTPHVTSLCLFSNTYTTILVIFYLLLPIDAFFKKSGPCHINTCLGARSRPTGMLKLSFSISPVVIRYPSTTYYQQYRLI